MRRNPVRQLLEAKHDLCKHQSGCLVDAFKQSGKQILYGSILAIILQSFTSLKSLLKSKSLGKINKKAFSIVLFLVCSTLALRCSQCSLRWLRNKNDSLNSIISGAAAGYVSTLTLSKDYWYTLLMLLASRVVLTIYNILLDKRWLNPQRKWLHYFLMFACSTTVNAYGYFLEPDILKPDVYNLYERMSVLTKNEKQWHHAALVGQYNSFKSKGYLFFDDYFLKKIAGLKMQIGTQ